MAPPVTLPTRLIGDTPVSAMGFGAMGFSAFYIPKDKTDEGRLKDTSDVYGDNEDLIGKWFERTGKRDDIFLATKFGLAHGDPSRKVNCDPSYVRTAFENSCRRLKTDHIDLWYVHRADPTVPIELTIKAMAELVKGGRVKYLGLSEVSARTLRRAHAVHPIAALQSEYSPITLDIEAEDEVHGVMKACRELGVKVIAYSPLGRGFLTGQIKSRAELDPDDYRLLIPRFSEENFPRVLQLAAGLKAIGEKHTVVIDGKAQPATAGQVALAWVLAQGEDVIPIPGTTKEKYLKENIAALQLELTDAELAQVRRVAEEAQASVGDRVDSSFMPTLFAETPELA
ncbi:Aldo/keto reductase [Schizophyllum commune H4-8]|uniref:NADP-dependent oxidoreductase domain-containing protein n=1 Tax=Schizophyllum commune (strain H4-8 / FGSC 9210) TaxID=578458 RepID=D8PXS7_SCHCM|nr:Aldo/keto reductase [Schizophyllum commune H4-8]KAI5897034.1 Aldo/keto reductase [Schizophyllum commune H4-8]